MRLTLDNFTHTFKQNQDFIIGHNRTHLKYVSVLLCLKTHHTGNYKYFFQRHDYKSNLNILIELRPNPGFIQALFVKPVQRVWLLYIHITV